MSLSHNLGIGVFGGIFVKKLTRGSQLPTLPCLTRLTTMLDNQENAMIRILTGERPFIRYSSPLGTISIQNLPKAKAYDLEIEISISVDKNETWIVNAWLPKQNQNLSVNIKKALRKKFDKNPVVEAQKFKRKDKPIVSKIEKCRDIIKVARNKYSKSEHEERVNQKMNLFVQWLTENSQNIDEADIDTCYKMMIEYFKKENLPIDL
jgi:molecular chaperone DnaK (HSP70)